MGKMSRDKGKRGEREFAALCSQYGYDCRRGQQYNGIGGEDVVGLPGIHIEVKRTERLDLYGAMAQAIGDAHGEIPIVAHRRNNCAWLVVIQANDWMPMYSEWECGREEASNGRDNESDEA